MQVVWWRGKGTILCKNVWIVYLCAFSMHKFCWEYPSKSNIKWTKNCWDCKHLSKICILFRITTAIVLLLIMKLRRPFLYSLLSASVVPQLSWFVWNWTLQQLTDMNLNELRKKNTFLFPKTSTGNVPSYLW